jgi:threonine dehydrogenase-like Zn-dependent dehydrogenase
MPSTTTIAVAQEGGDKVRLETSARHHLYAQVAQCKIGLHHRHSNHQPNMHAIRKLHPTFGLEAQDVPEPDAPASGDVIVRVEAVGICGSDVHIYEWTDGYDFMTPHLAVTLGHEFSGHVAAVGPDTTIDVGTRVAVVPTVVCRSCSSCRAGEPQGCSNRRAIGLTRDGGFARLVQVPETNLLRLPEQVDAELGALIAVLVGEVRLGDTVLVLGPGTIGQGFAMMARAAGAGRVIVVGHADGPRFDVLKRLGFNELVDVADATLADQVMRLTGGAQVDVVLEATGHPPSIAEGLGVLKKGGVLVVAGIHPGPLTLPLTEFVRNRHQLRASHSTARRTWDRVTSLIARNPEGFRPMITHRMPLERGTEGFEFARQRVASKVMLNP